MSDTLVWISGATDGMGLGIARNCPYKNARIINISRRESSQFETVTADLASRAGWAKVRQHFTTMLADFKGARALFIHNAYFAGHPGVVTMVPADEYELSIVLNGAAPMILGHAFLNAAKHLDCEVGLCLISSSAVEMTIPGVGGYAGCKIGAEYWAQVANSEFRLQHEHSWVCAVRPGGIKTPGNDLVLTYPPERFPWVGALRQMMNSDDCVDIDTAGRRVWKCLPPKNGDYLLTVTAERKTIDPALEFGAKMTYVA
jgi:short-subunit dehydrogenase